MRSFKRGGALIALSLVLSLTLSARGELRADPTDPDADAQTRTETRPALKLQPRLGDYARGEYLAQHLDCAGCHGAAGQGQQQGWPKLAGQYEQYLLNTLRNFRDGQRPHSFMKIYADHLTDKAIHDLALYYACQGDDPGVADKDRCPPAS
jgi:cytochrome c553